MLALGGELKNTLCLVKDAQAVVSQHLGDLEDARTANEFERAVALYRDIYDLAPALLAVDRHPDYRSTQYGQRLAANADIPIVPIQHHHAHVAAVLAESGWPAGDGPVLGLALDGHGMGSDGSSWPSSPPRRSPTSTSMSAAWTTPR